MFLALISLITLSTPTLAESSEIFRIEIGKDYRSYSNSELQRRVWELERAVWQLQQRVFQLELNSSRPNPPTPPKEEWLCTVKAMGNVFTGTGFSKAAAKSKAMNACKAARDGDGFFCKDAGCEQ